MLAGSIPVKLDAMFPHALIIPTTSGCVIYQKIIRVKIEMNIMIATLMYRLGRVVQRRGFEPPTSGLWTLRPDLAGLSLFRSTVGNRLPPMLRLNKRPYSGEHESDDENELCKIGEE